MILTKEDEDFVLPVVKFNVPKKTDSFLDDDILKYLHREVDEEAIETEFDVKVRCKYLYYLFCGCFADM